MKIDAGLESLQREVELILSTDLPAQRRYYLEGARDYLNTLKRMAQDEASSKRNRTKKDQEPAAQA